MGLLQNGLDFKFRGGCEALGPKALLILTFLLKYKVPRDLGHRIRLNI